MDETYGIIFYKYEHNKLNIYLKRNLKYYYEDVVIKDHAIINKLNDINILYKVHDNTKKHNIFLLNVTKYKNIYDIIINEKINMQIVNLKKFMSIPFHKTLKHDKLKINDLNKSLTFIRNNYFYRNLK